MKFHSCLPLAFAVVFSATSPAPQPPSPELLAKLAQSAAQADQIQRNAAFTLTSVSEELGDKDAVQHREERVVQFRIEGGKQKSELVAARNDGKDVLAAEKKKADEQHRDSKGGKRGGFGMPLPFLPDEQPHYRFAQIGPDPKDPQKLVISFEPLDDPEHRAIGTARVDAATGRVLSAHMHPAKMPTFVDRADIAVDFDAQTPRGPAVSRMEIRGRGGLLMFKQDVRATLTFSDYQLAP